MRTASIPDDDSSVYDHLFELPTSVWVSEPANWLVDLDDLVYRISISLVHVGEEGDLGHEMAVRSVAAVVCGRFQTVYGRSGGGLFGSPSFPTNQTVGFRKRCFAFAGVTFDFSRKNRRDVWRASDDCPAVSLRFCDNRTCFLSSNRMTFDTSKVTSRAIWGSFCTTCVSRCWI
jgi:hypothetical protein